MGKGQSHPPTPPPLLLAAAGGSPHCPRGPQERGWEGGSPFPLFFFFHI